jgi:hypothetical protein
MVVVVVVVVVKSKALPQHLWRRRGEKRYSSYSFTTSALDVASGQRHAPATLYPPITIAQEAGWAPEPVWTHRLRGKTLLPLPGIEPRSPGRPVCSQTVVVVFITVVVVVAAPAMLLKLYCYYYS